MRKLCIAIPTYNRCEELKRALDDLLAIVQSNSRKNEIEILISNNGSTDNTPSIINQFTKEFTILGVPLLQITNPTNIGFDKNLLNCFINCGAEYVWYLSDDDIIRSEALTHILNDVDSYNPNCILYNFNQPPHVFNDPLIKENLYFDKVDESNLNSISKIIHWPKMSSIVMKSAKSLQNDFKKIEYKFMHVGLFCHIALSHGKILHSRKFVAGIDEKYLEKIDFLPFVANYMSETIHNVFTEVDRVNLLSHYLDKFPTKYESPLISCINFLADYHKKGIPIKSQLRREIYSTIYLELKKCKTIDRIKIIIKWLPIYLFSYIEQIVPIQRLKKIIKILLSRKAFINNVWMPTKINISENFKPDWFYTKKSYSQYGEDILIEQVLERLKISPADVYYLDIGSNHPLCLSNTYYFYKKGGFGVCIEPDEQSYKNFKKKRPRDKCLNVGVSIDNSKFSDIYLMTANVLNTFSFDEAEKITALGTYKIKDSKRVTMININEILQKECMRLPDFISLDVEGLDSKILETFDFEKYRPPIFCIETLSYGENSNQIKNQKILDCMKHNNYRVFADTFINTIFVDSRRKEFN